MSILCKLCGHESRETERNAENEIYPGLHSTHINKIYFLDSFPAKLHGGHLQFSTSLLRALSWLHGTTMLQRMAQLCLGWRYLAWWLWWLCVANHWLSSCCLSLSRLCGEGTLGHHRWFVSPAIHSSLQQGFLVLTFFSQVCKNCVWTNVIFLFGFLVFIFIYFFIFILGQV